MGDFPKFVVCSCPISYWYVTVMVDSGTNVVGEMMMEWSQSKVMKRTSVFQGIIILNMLWLTWRKVAN